MISCIIPHYYHTRIPTVARIIVSLEADVDEILIWNNDAPFDEAAKRLIGDRVRIIQASHNYGCQGRFAAVKHIDARTKYVLFHDNDLVAKPGSVQLLRIIAEKYPGDIAALFGEHRPFGGRAIALSFGRFELIPRPSLDRILATWRNDETSLHDDFWLSITAEKLGIQRHFIRFPIKNFHDGLGFTNQWPRAAWLKERRRIFEHLMRIL